MNISIILMKRHFAREQAIQFHVVLSDTLTADDKRDRRTSTTRQTRPDTASQSLVIPLIQLGDLKSSVCSFEFGLKRDPRTDS